MTGETAQIVALTCYGNAFLQGTDVGESFIKNSTCKYCDSVAFVSVKKIFFWKIEEKEVAKTPEEWFEFVRTSNAIGIRLSWAPRNYLNLLDRMSAAFVGAADLVNGGSSAEEPK